MMVRVVEGEGRHVDWRMVLDDGPVAVDVDCIVQLMRLGVESETAREFAIVCSFLEAGQVS